MYMLIATLILHGQVNLGQVLSLCCIVLRCTDEQELSQRSTASGGPRAQPDIPADDSPSVILKEPVGITHQHRPMPSALDLKHRRTHCGTSNAMHSTN